MGSPGDARKAVDALVKHTVHRVLFSTAANPRTEKITHTKCCDNEVVVAAIDPRDVLRGYTTLSDDKLKAQTKMLKRRLKSVLADGRELSSALQAPGVAAAVEAYALLHLFIKNRQGQYNGTSTRLLHAQLALYAEYFARVHHRQISSVEDIAAVKIAYNTYTSRSE